jgi:hypothetical protein
MRILKAIGVGLASGMATRLDRLSRRGELRGFAASDYEPAISQASAELDVATNAGRDAPWYSALSNLHTTLEYPLLSVDRDR